MHPPPTPRPACLLAAQVTPVSQAQARQRSGRAGREAPGKAFRLYTEASFQQLPPTTLPEIQRTNLASVVLQARGAGWPCFRPPLLNTWSSRCPRPLHLRALSAAASAALAPPDRRAPQPHLPAPACPLQLKALGVADVVGFDFMDPPPRAALLRSLELLLALGALDARGDLTQPVGVHRPRGRRWGCRCAVGATAASRCSAWPMAAARCCTVGIRPPTVHPSLSFFLSCFLSFPAGAQLARLPVEPMYGKVLLASGEMGCSVEAVAVVAMVSTDVVFHLPRWGAGGGPQPRPCAGPLGGGRGAGRRAGWEGTVVAL